MINLEGFAAGADPGRYFCRNIVREVSFAVVGNKLKEVWWMMGMFVAAPGSTPAYVSPNHFGKGL